MSHFRSYKRVNLGKTLRASTLALLGSAAFLSTALPAHAARSQAPQTRQEITQTRLASMKGADVSRIDWRQPEMKLKFDLTESDWIDGIDLILSMIPQGNVAKRGPVLVSLNNSAPLKMNPYGQGFEARLRFDESFVRPKNNVITIRVPAPDGAPCLTSEHGHWDVNVKKSSIVVRTRAKSRNFYLREVAERLKNPTTAPKSVALLAYGSQKERLQMLGAQGIALQTEEIPTFKTAGRADMQIIMGRRDQLSPRVTDRDILSETGPKISVHKGRPMRLVITGDTDGEVLRSVKAFASHHLPEVRRRETSSGEVTFQTAFSDTHTVLKNKTRFSELNQTIYATDWRGTPNVVMFNVDDPTTKSGKVMLRLSSSSKITKDSRVEVEVNGESLGFTTLDRRRKSVNFDIPEGALQGVENELKIIPQLDRQPSAETFGAVCPALDDLPGFFVGDGSRIELTSSGATPASELSRLTSGGGLFASGNGANTQIVLTATTQNDYGASLGLLAKLAKTSGSGWTEAQVVRKATASTDKNVLVIGPNATRSGALSDTPRALSTALKGKSSTGQLVSNFGDYEKFASNDAAKTLQLYAAKTRAKSRIGSGGVAAVYPEGERLIGVISNTPGRSFASVSKDLTHGQQWNKLSGSVARWNSKSVLMAQTAIPTPGMSVKKPSADILPQFAIANLDMSWLEDSFLDATIRMRDLSDSAGEKFQLAWNDLEARLTGADPATQPKYAKRTPKADAPVYVPKGSEALATSSRPTLREPVKTAELSLSTTAVGKLVAPLRGFSRAESDVKPDSRAPRWLMGLLSKFQTADTTSTDKKTASLETDPYTQSFSQKTARAVSDLSEDLSMSAVRFKNVIASDVSATTKLKRLSDGSFGFFGVLLGISVLIFLLLLSTIKPSKKSS